MQSGPAIADISCELALLIDCCRCNFRNASNGDLRTTGLDFDRFLELVRHHRVEGHAWNALTETQSPLPDAVATSLKTSASTIAVQNLKAGAECKALLVDFEAAKIPLLFLKGLTLGGLAYAKPMLKMGWDVDLLVSPDQLRGASNILRSRGYRLVLPADAARLEAWHRRRKESVWANDAGVYVELHSRLADNRLLISRIDVRSPSRNVDVSEGVSLPTLADEELFAYLCVHGASSAWFRLKWIADLAGLLHGRPPAEIELLYQRSQELGAWRAADQALLLADALFGSLDGTDLKPRLLRDRASRTLFNAALRQLLSASEPTKAKFGTWRIHWTQLLLKPGLAFKVGEAARQVRDAIV